MSKLNKSTFIKHKATAKLRTLKIHVLIKSLCIRYIGEPHSNNRSCHKTSRLQLDFTKLEKDTCDRNPKEQVLEPLYPQLIKFNIPTNKSMSLPALGDTGVLSHAW